MPAPDRPEPSTNGARDPYAAFRIPTYRAYLFGWIIQILGTRIQAMAIAWEMYERVNEPMALGYVGLAHALPLMLLALPAGLLADRYDRVMLVRLSLLGMTLTSVGLAYLSYTEGSIVLMYILLFLDASAVTLGRPARAALLPQIVPTNVFANAVTWNMSLQHLSAVLGPALGGLVIAFSVPAAYVITALSSLVFIGTLSRFKLINPTHARSSMSLAALGEGFRFLWNTRIILATISIDLFAVLLGGAVYLLPIYATDILKVDEVGFGWLRAAPAVGAATMALMMVFLPPIQKAGRALLLNVALFGVATIVFGYSTNFWISFAMLFLTGAFDNVSMVIRQTLQQLLTPNEMRGRVSAVTSIFVGASNDLGGFESSLLAQWFGPVFSVVSGGIGTILVVGLAARMSPQLRNYGALDAPPPAPAQAEARVAVPAPAAPVAAAQTAPGSADD